MKPIIKRMAMTALVIAGSISVAEEARANTPIFVYTNRDMLLTFRKTGATGGTTSAANLEVDIGQASIYYGATPGSTINVTQFSASQLSDVFDSLDDLSWSVGAMVPLGDTGDASVPLRTLWVTAPRYDAAIPASPWVRNSSTTQATTVSAMNSILANASFYSGTVAGGSLNSVNVVSVPVGSGHEAGAFLGMLGNYKNTFQGNAENTTPPTFTEDGQPSRSDLYELRPDNTGTQPAGKYLGYFEFRTDGTLVFVAQSATPPPPPVLTVSAAGDGTGSVSFATVAGATYSLYYTDVAGLASPVSTWTVAPTNIIGDGAVHSFQINLTGSGGFYRVKAQ